MKKKIHKKFRPMLAKEFCFDSIGVDGLIRVSLKFDVPVDKKQAEQRLNDFIASRLLVLLKSDY